MTECVSSDFMIEQVFMRSLKTSGGLTRGKGFEEYQRTLWLLSSPVYGEVSALMKALQCLNEPENTKHKESPLARQNKDHKDQRRFVNFIQTRNRIDTARSSLVSIVTGKETSCSVNADSAREIGEDILPRMTSTLVDQLAFKKQDKVKTMMSSSDVKKTTDCRTRKQSN